MLAMHGVVPEHYVVFFREDDHFVRLLNEFNIVLARNLAGRTLSPESAWYIAGADNKISMVISIFRGEGGIKVSDEGLRRILDELRAMLYTTRNLPENCSVTLEIDPMERWVTVVDRKVELRPVQVRQQV